MRTCIARPLLGTGSFRPSVARIAWMTLRTCQKVKYHEGPEGEDACNLKDVAASRTTLSENEDASDSGAALICTAFPTAVIACHIA